MCDAATLSDRGYTSDSELYQQQQQQQQLMASSSSASTMINANSDKSLEQLSIKTNGDEAATAAAVAAAAAALRAASTAATTISSNANQYKIDLDDEGLGQHDKKAFAKSCETLTLLIRDMAHVSLQNFEICIHCLRTFVEACVIGGKPKKYITKIGKKIFGTHF